MNVSSLQNIVLNKGEIDYLNDPVLSPFNRIIEKYRVKYKCVICGLLIKEGGYIRCSDVDEICYWDRIICFRCAINASVEPGKWNCGCRG